MVAEMMRVTVVVMMLVVSMKMSEKYVDNDSDPLVTDLFWYHCFHCITTVGFLKRMLISTGSAHPGQCRMMMRPGISAEPRDSRII